VEVSLDIDVPADVKEVSLPVDLFDAQNKRLSTATLKVPIAGDRPWRASLLLDKIAETNKQHHVTIGLTDATLGVDYGAELYFAAESATVQYFGLTHEGLFLK